MGVMQEARGGDMPLKDQRKSTVEKASQPSPRGRSLPVPGEGEGGAKKEPRRKRKLQRNVKTTLAQGGEKKNGEKKLSISKDA